MSGRFAYRVKMMERRVSAPGKCPECHGLMVVKPIMEGDPMPEPCPGCGRAKTVVRYVVAKPPDDWNPPKNTEIPLA